MCHSTGAPAGELRWNGIAQSVGLRVHKVPRGAEQHKERLMCMFNKVTKTFQWGQHTVTLETGEVARQSSGAVIVNVEDTVILATVVGAKNAKPGQDFFPLTVDYIEKTYAAGKIPGGFFKREGRPSEKETLTCRLIDRPIRPLFPDGFYNEVQVVATVMSLNPEVDSDIPALIA